MSSLTEQQVDTLWAASSQQGMQFLTEMCERWMDGSEAERHAYEETIRSCVKGSKIAAAVGM